jgi:polyhydroxybutyrate depolymerase
MTFSDDKTMRTLTNPVKTTYVLLMLVVITACGSDLPTFLDWEGTGVLGEYVVHNGVKRAYALNIPTSYDSSEALPLLIMFHGGGDTGPNFQRWSGLDSVAGAAGFVTAYPNASGLSCPDDVPVLECDDSPPFLWDSGDLQYLPELIAHLRHELYIDSTRIYGAGFSNGSIFAHTVGCELAHEMTALAAISGTMDPQTAFSCSPSLTVPILLLHGTEDPSFPWGGEGIYLSVSSTVSGWADINGCLDEPTENWLPDSVDDGTRVWTETYTGCDENSEVLFYGVEGGGHTWPGVSGFPPNFGLTSLDISVNEELIAFFSRHQRR